MSLSAKREALARIHGRYQRAGRPHKTRILDEFCVTCGYHRKAALRLLNRPLSGLGQLGSICMHTFFTWPHDMPFRALDELPVITAFILR